MELSDLLLICSVCGGFLVTGAIRKGEWADAIAAGISLAVACIVYIFG